MARKKRKDLPKEFNYPMRAVKNDTILAKYNCPRCGESLTDKKRCEKCQQLIVFPWERDWNLLDYADCNIMEDMIDKMDNTPVPELAFDVNEQMNIYSWLLELKEYRKIGSLAKIMEKM